MNIGKVQKQRGYNTFASERTMSPFSALKTPEMDRG